MAIKEFVKTLPLALGLLASPLWAAVSPEQASALGDSLTPMGAERAGNASGEIPAWQGGLAKDAGRVDAGGFLSDPFAGEQPLFVITAQNMQEYRDRLTLANRPCSSATRTAFACRYIPPTVQPTCRRTGWRPPAATPPV